MLWLHDFWLINKNLDTIKFDLLIKTWIPLKLPQHPILDSANGTLKEIAFCTIQYSS